MSSSWVVGLLATAIHFALRRKPSDAARCVRCGAYASGIMCDRSLLGEPGACVFIDPLPVCSDCGATCLDVAQGIGKYSQCYGQTCVKKLKGSCALESDACRFGK